MDYLLFILFGLTCFAYVDNSISFTSLVSYKPVKQEVSCTVILPPMVSVLWIAQENQPESANVVVMCNDKNDHPLVLETMKNCLDE